MTNEHDPRNKNWFIVGNWTQSMDNARYYKTFKEALEAQIESNIQLIKEDRLNEHDMYLIYRVEEEV